MDHGVIVQVATPAEIYEAPNSRYVADFIGSVNIFDGTVDVTAPDRTRIAAVDGFVIDAAAGGSAEKGATVWFAVRPEKVAIAHTAPAETGINAVAGEVWDIAYFGDMTLYNVRLASGKLVRATLMNAQRSVERPITWEDKVWLSWAADSGVLLTK
jgi:putrescine transport system ATP-binding protein